MGQMTYGLCYGIPDQKIEGFDLETTLVQYEKAKADVIARIAKTSDNWTAWHRVVPEWEGDSEPAFLGFFVAAGASGKNGIPFLNAFQLDALDGDKRYKKAMKNAGDGWAAFSDWCSLQGICLPEPHLWLIATEVA